MSLDPATIGGLKTVGSLAARPTYQFLCRQLARRHAEDGLPSGIVDTAPELDEALDVLGGGEGLVGRLMAQGKAWASDRPEAFSHEKLQRWARDGRVRALIKAAVVRTFQGLGLDAEKREALALYQELTGEVTQPVERSFEDAVVFLALTLESYLPVDARAQIENANANREEIVDALGTGLRGIDRKLDAVHNRLDGAAPVEVLDTFVAAAVERALRWRSFAEARPVEEILAVAEPARDGGLKGASTGMRQRAFREAAAALARVEHQDEAAAWLGVAKALGHANDFGVDDARLALTGGDADAAIRLLRDRDDPAARSLLLEAVRKKDGERAALHLFEARIKDPTSLTGHGLLSLADAALKLNDAERAHALLSAASTEQISDSPPLLLVRARIAASLCLPAEMRALFLEHLSLFPLGSALRNDATGRGLIDAALADARAFRREIASLALPGTTALAERLEVWLGLVSPDGGVQRSTVDHLSRVMRDPEKALEFVQFACAFDVPFDRSALGRRLDEATALGGWTDEQCLAAFHLVLDGSEPGRIVAFVDLHHRRLAALLDQSFLDGLLIEVLAKAGEVGRARRLLEERRGTPGAINVEFLDTVVAEAEGGNPVELRIATFDKSQHTRDLQHLVDALRAHGDHRRLSLYLPELWTRRHHVKDARDACDAFVLAGDEDGLEAFLATLGPVGEADPDLKLHRAWSASRAGDVLTASRLATELAEAGHVDPNLRALRINLAIETGRWDDLHAILKNDLDQREARDAEELLQAAEVGLAVGNRDAKALLEAAVARAPNDPGILAAAYMGLVRRGEEETDPQARLWFQRAVERSGPEGPLQAKEVGEAIEIIRMQRDHARELSSKVFKGDIPLFMAAAPLNLPLSEVFFGILPENVDRDPRHRVPVPLFAGNRGPVDLSGVTAAGLDPNALLLQAELGFLGKVIAAFDQVVIDRRSRGRQRPALPAAAGGVGEPARGRGPGAVAARARDPHPWGLVRRDRHARRRAGDRLRRLGGTAGGRPGALEQSRRPCRDGRAQKAPFPERVGHGPEGRGER